MAKSDRLNRTKLTFIANGLPLQARNRILGHTTGQIERLSGHSLHQRNTSRSRHARFAVAHPRNARIWLCGAISPPERPKERRATKTASRPRKKKPMTDTRVAVVAVGGNALIRDKNKKTIQDQYVAACEMARHIGAMIQDGWNVILTHGNGPQVGFDMRRSELAAHEIHPVPLDYCDADTQGAIGYMFQRALRNEFKHRDLEKVVATVVSLVRVHANDPAFQNPTKPIGSFLDEKTAQERAKEGKTVIEDAGRGWRQVVPSPKPVEIIEAEAIKALINAGTIVIATGGGGIPVVENEAGDLIGIEAVIDKDFTSSLLANVIGVDLLLFSTGVEKVALNFNTPNVVWLDKMTIAEAKQYIEEGQFAAGSMKPKIEACIKFLENGGKQVLITDLENVPRALRGETGTWIVP
ncbi:carbamate kinase [Gracilaria domingensis]|nr:carbamate kinase [Gracilaria domingensis]